MLLAVAHILSVLRQGGLRQIGDLDVLLTAFFQEHIIDLEEIVLLGLTLLLGLRS